MTPKQRDRGLQAAIDLVAAQKRKIDRLQRRIASLEKQIAKLQDAQICGYPAGDGHVLLDAV